MRAPELYALGVVLCLFVLEAHSQCNGRKVLTADQGTITDGNGNYTPVAHCEWLIDGNGNSSILLTFSSMKTECSYDFLFVYDGKSYESPLLASLSGDQLPKPLLATSGYMLMYLYSDRNYELEGFKATYEIMDCPYGCSGEGTCTDGLCNCVPGKYGIGCEKHQCPNECNSKNGQGECDSSGKCRCKGRFMGENCSMSRNDGRGNNTWYLLASETAGFKARTSHAGVFIESLDSLWIFGGFTLNEVLDELILFNMTSNKWETVEKSTPWPAGRYLHAMVAVNDGFVLYGGQIYTGELSDELWYFDGIARTWSLIQPSPDSVRLPKLASHSLTLGKDWIYLFGGKTHHGYFSSDMYRIRAQNLSDSQRIFIKGGKIASRRLAGHSAIYHGQTNSLLIFGGHSTNTAQFSRLRNELHIFHIDNSFWSLVYEDPKNKDLPSQRAYHSAVILGDYMVIYGGNTHVHDGFDLCYDSAIYYYHLGCYKWISSQNFDRKFPGLGSNTKPSRRFGHVAVAAYGNSLLISGGYSGYVLGDLLAFKVAPAIAVHKDITLDMYDHCTVYSNENCESDPACSICNKPLSVSCVNRASKDTCTERGKEAPCQGFCSQLQSCDSCLNLGGHYPTSKGDNSWYYLRFQYCAWCVKEAKCQPATALSGTCKDVHITSSGRMGWWNGLSVHLTELRQCLTEDRPAGLHYLRYRSPHNYSYPDELTIIRKTDKALQFKSWIEKENVKSTQYKGRFVGYIYPLDISNGYPINMSLSTSQSEAMLYLSKDDNPKNKELVAKQPNRGSASTINAARPDNSPLFPNVARGYKYYVELESTQLITGNDKQPEANMELLRNNSVSAKHWSAEFLEPFRSDNCSQYSNCLACLADTACGWCTENSACHHRDATHSQGQVTCGTGVERHLVLTSTDCPTCIDHVDCRSCVMDDLCEWVPDYLFCIRRGRFEDSARNTSACQVPCKSHTSCETCLEYQNECAWCENQQTCFTFSEYMTRFKYGQCLKWLDWEAKNGVLKLQCHSCELHTACKDCMKNFGCGWCSTDENPAIGKCMQGDFSGPVNGVNCTSLVVTNSSNSTDNVSWAYGVCPDVQECQLGLHDCHENASCVNTLDGYNCTCHRGFVGNGRDRCEKTCYHTCMKGNCSGHPDYVCQCSLGWTGDSCNISCGCNNHSTCENGVGTCDYCQHNTAGDQCEFCQQGSYGDPQLPSGCQLCQCNGHGDESLGTCHNSTGKCFCIDNTYGNLCQHCDRGYHGDPRNGQRCYLECDDRRILTDIKYGSLGSFHSLGLGRSRTYCLWILTLFPDIDSPFHNQVIPNITLEIEPDISVKCPEDFVYVYDGLPHFASGKKEINTRLLGAFCGEGHLDIPAVTARSGILTVFYQSDIRQGVTSRGFNASYYVSGCPDDCNYGNRECVDGKCVCLAGFKGDNCEEEICPQNCSSALNQGYCDIKGCVCQPGFVGNACEVELLPHVVVIQSTFPVNDTSLEHDLARMGHTMSKCGNDSLYVFGGYSLRQGALSDLYHLNLTSGQWTVVEPQSESAPSGRYFHSAACLPYMQALYMYGGLVTQEGEEPYKSMASRELWKFNLESRMWVLEEVPKWVHTLAGHTMTQVSDTRLILIGGFSIENYFSNKVYEYDTARGLMAWKENMGRTDGRMNGATPIGLFGHTSVFHEASNTLYVYGGYAYRSDSFGPSGNLYTFDLDRKEWNIIQPEKGEQPLPRFFHAAVGREHDMVILGGMTEEMEMTGSIQVYRYMCNTWLTVSNPEYVSIVGNLGPAIGQTAVAIGNSIYIFGGYNGVTMGSLINLTIPEDVCQIVKDSTMCQKTGGCSGCVVPTSTSNQSYCYSSGLKAPDSCYSSNATLRQGALCTENWLNARDCEQFTNCSQCLAVYPQFKQAKMACKWCGNCNVGRCVSSKERCDVKKCGGVDQTQIFLAKDCVEQRCQAADCQKCKDLNSQCLWTTHTKRTSEVMRSVTSVARYTGNCMEHTANLNQLLSVYEKCPRRCYTFSSCHKCLDTESAEGGAKTCVWSDELQLCLPAAAVPLLCTSGQCGYLINDPLEKSSRCPQDCAFHSRCSTCLKSPGCGWCAFGGMNGSGVCMAGGLHHPAVGVCTDGHVSLETSNQQAAESNRSLQRIGPIFWSFMECPPENECENNHHSCNSETEDCEDTPESYRCVCKKGYERGYEKVPGQQLECVPTCKQGCFRGRCVTPDHCECDFGWVGQNCSVECECNKHSNCKSENETKVCTGCANNTMGPQCSLCKPFFVGDPRDGKSCIPCRDFCHNHTEFCVTKEESVFYAVDQDSPYINSVQLRSKIRQGPKVKDTVCLSCQHNTTGERCDSCLTGYFRISQENKLIQPCLKCQCNGHSATCDESTGENCACHNSTETSCNKDSKEKRPCWQKQCSECREYFLGHPINGHQCYRHMTMEQDYCFDPNTQNRCSQDPTPLHQGRTVFFSVQPKYLNVDIRITVDVTEGATDVYFSPCDDTFLVDVDPLGFHTILVDPNYQFFSSGNTVFHGQRRNVANCSQDKSNYRKQEIEANELNTFVTVNYAKTLLLVKNVRFRLVITLPLDVHDLRSSRFYVILRSRGLTATNQTFGSLYFRQDQPHIDLFVFFSVFFSCFFLFLAKCVLLWKVKQTFDARRTRQQRAREMKHMASRPFARVLVYVEQEPPTGLQPSYQRRNNRLPKIRANRNDPLNSGTNPTTTRESPFNVAPIAVEPTDDGIAAVGTVILRMPGGNNAPCKLSLGSSLMTRLHSGPTGNHSQKVNIRRRYSASFA